MKSAANALFIHITYNTRAIFATVISTPPDHKVSEHFLQSFSGNFQYAHLQIQIQLYFLQAHHKNIQLINFYTKFSSLQK